MKKYFIIVALFYFQCAQSQIIYQDEEVPGLSEFHNSSAVSGDFNNDGFIDIISCGVTSSSSFATQINLNNGDGTFTVSSVLTNLGLGGIATADVDGDNDLDIFITGRDNLGYHHAYLYLNDGLGNFTVTTQSFTPVIIANCKFGDLDGDLDMDLIVSGNDEAGDSQLTVYYNDGIGNFTEIVSNPFLPITGTIEILDYDYDNNNDIFISGYVGSTGIDYSYLYKNDGAGSFNHDASNTLAPRSSGCSDTIDLNQDGFVDLIYTGRTWSSSTTQTFIYMNDGLGNYTELTGHNLTSNNSGSIIANDFDNNGTVDILITRINNSALYSGGQNFPDFNLIYEFAGISTSAPKALIFDYDVDGDTDIYLSGFYCNPNNCKMFSYFSCPEELNLNVDVNSPVLTAQNTEASAYRWLFCDFSMGQIPGQTNISYEAESNGNYAVKITQLGCVDTSDCYSITDLSIENNDNNINIYPNPTSDILNIEFSEGFKFVIINEEGKVVLSGNKEVNSNNYSIDITGLRNGSYLIILQKDTELIRYRFVKSSH